MLPLRRSRRNRGAGIVHVNEIDWSGAPSVTGTTERESLKKLLPIIPTQESPKIRNFSPPVNLIKKKESPPLELVNFSLELPAIPKGIIDGIFNLLRPQDFIVLSCVSKTLLKLTSDDKYWKTFWKDTLTKEMKESKTSMEIQQKIFKSFEEKQLIGFRSSFWKEVYLAVLASPVEPKKEKSNRGFFSRVKTIKKAHNHIWKKNSLPTAV